MVSRRRRPARRRPDAENPYLSPTSTTRLHKKTTKKTLEGGEDKPNRCGSSGGKRKRKKDYSCFVCHSQSHFAKDCPDRVEGEGCFVCQSLDHKANSCPEKAEREKKIKKKVPHLSSSESLPGRPGAPDCPYENCTLGSQCKYNHPKNPKNKVPRKSSAEYLPERPGQPDCPYEKCTFGLRCKYNHPKNEESGLSVKKVAPFTPALFHNSKGLPIRPGEEDCPFFLMTGSCEKGTLCGHKHPDRNAIHPPVAVALGQAAFPYSAINQPIGVRNPAVSLLPNITSLLNETALGVSPTVYLQRPGEMSYNVPHNSPPESLPERPGEPNCPYEKCTFGLQCKYNHPKNKMPGSSMNRGSPFSPSLWLNSKGLPIRPGEEDCPFYLMARRCKKGALCRHNHPDGNAINPPVAVASGHALMSSSTTNQPTGDINAAASLLPNITPHLYQNALGVSPTVFVQQTGEMICDLEVRPTVFPQQPGEMICDSYMKTGNCKFGGTCKFHHPIDRPAVPTPPTVKQAVQQDIRLTLAGLPRREGSVFCRDYMNTGICVHGAGCKYDHPTPAEAIARTTLQGSSLGSGAAAAGEVYFC